MDKWEYLSALVAWNSEKQNWGSKLQDGRKMEAGSPGELFNPLGQSGWELVAFTPKHYQEDNNVHTISGVAMHTVTEWDVWEYRAVFKRKLP